MPRSLHLYRAIVVDTNDPQAAARLKLTIPTTVKGQPATLEAWVQVASMPLGSLFSSLPKYGVGDEVIVAAERLPSSGAVVVGCSRPAAQGPAQSASVLVALPNGQQLQLDAEPGGVSVASGGATVRLGLDGTVELSASSVKVAASQVEVDAAQVVVNAGLVKFSGVVQCDTLIANSVVAASYSPGAGNVW